MSRIESARREEARREEARRIEAERRQKRALAEAARLHALRASGCSTAAFGTAPSASAAAFSDALRTSKGTLARLRSNLANGFASGLSGASLYHWASAQSEIFTNAHIDHPPSPALSEDLTSYHSDCDGVVGDVSDRGTSTPRFSAPPFPRDPPTDLPLLSLPSLWAQPLLNQFDTGLKSSASKDRCRSNLTALEWDEDPMEVVLAPPTTGESTAQMLQVHHPGSSKRRGGECLDGFGPGDTIVEALKSALFGKRQRFFS